MDEWVWNGTLSNADSADSGLLGEKWVDVYGMVHWAMLTALTAMFY